MKGKINQNKCVKALHKMIDQELELHMTNG